MWRIRRSPRANATCSALCAPAGPTKRSPTQLEISEPLVKMIVHQLFDKTGVRSRSPLVRLALEIYWREPDEDFEGTSA